MKLSHLHILRSLKAQREYHPDWAFTYDTIMYYIPSTFDVNQIRKSMVLLREQGLVDYVRTFSEDDYLVCGSGHQISDRGESLLTVLEELNQVNDEKDKKARLAYEQSLINQGRSAGFDELTWEELSEQGRQAWRDKTNS